MAKAHGLSVVMLLGIVQGLTAQTDFQTTDELKAEVGADTEVLSRGPLHEAFATPTSHQPVEWPVIKRRPPDPIDELIPEHKPSGEFVQWVPGYWAFENDLDDFIWISGLWRHAPPSRQWVPGYWREVEGGHRWNPGVWVETSASLAYQPRPPKSLEHGASSQRPSPNHFYVPGCWVYQNQNHKWRPGYWAPQQRDWVWVPARYTRAGNRYIYSDGYWDRTLPARGQLFAPVYFKNKAYARANFQYRPTCVISTDTQLLTHLFVQPIVGQFVFGDYYGDKYRDNYRPWYKHFGSQGGYDPLLSHCDWSSTGNLVQRLRSLNEYFNAHPNHRPRRTLSEQLAFASSNAQFEHLNQVVLGSTLKHLVARPANASQFVRVTDNVGQQTRSVTRQIQALSGQRLQLEGNAAGNAGEPLALPKIPALDRPVGRNFAPANPLKLRNGGQRLPIRRGGSNVPIPRLPLPRFPM